jgi:hypothetical protein
VRAWFLIASVVVGATAGWAAYFAYEFSKLADTRFKAHEIIAAAVGGVAFGVVSAILIERRRHSP